MTDEAPADAPGPAEPEKGAGPAEPEKYQSRAVDRVIFFSDAVVAIAITLLAIDLPAPAGHTVSAFLTSAREHDGEYLAFLVSFATISASWMHHHTVFRRVRREDAWLRHANMVWLLAIVLVPFATKLLANGGGDTLTVHAFRWGFYSLVQALASATLFVMARHMSAHELREQGGSAAMAGTDWRSYGTMIGFGLSIPVFFATTYGWVLWIAVPVLLNHLRRRGRGAGRPNSERDPDVTPGNRAI